MPQFVMSNIDGVTVTPLRQIPDERGAVFHMLKRTDPGFREFGEIYFSLVNPQVIKAWHIHREMWLNYAVPLGMIKFALYDDRDGSPTKGTVEEFFIGTMNYCLITVPPGVWNGFKCLGSTPALVANCATMPHHPDEISRVDPFENDIPYDWSLKHG